ncbi:outer membrane lipoprotein-sorting protein [Tropicibacter sp. S64]|uniref:outer membrane lipoprotein-sorting protein n=1 Tax=Tropicibacter sp. S64 TaxID=3415122 RepID=UPI003C7A6133
MKSAVAALLFLAGPALAEPALDLVTRYNARPIAAHGWQSVDLDLLTGQEITRHFGVINAWSAGGDMVDTLFLLDAPEGLRGTNYLLQEPKGQPDRLDVFLNLPVGLKQVIALEPEQLDEGLLGSDFAYRDIRWLLPEVGVSYALAGEEVIAGLPVTVLDAEVSEDVAGQFLWDRARFYLSQEPLFLMGADYLAGDAPLKQMRVEDLAQIDGHWIATLMTMRVGPERWSRITLKDVSFTARGYGPEAFTPAALPALGTTLRETGVIPVSEGGSE